MKKRLLLTCVTSVMTLFLMGGCASKPQEINPVSEVDNANKFNEELAYKRGYEKAREELRGKYIKEGYENALKIFQEYSKDIRSFEAGKYAIKDNLVTYPKIVSINSGNGIRLKSLGCEIRDTLTPEEIMRFYAKHENLVPKQSSSQKSGFGSNESFDPNGDSSSSFHSSSFADTQGNEPMYQTKRVIGGANDDTKKVYQRFTKNYTFQDQITKYDLTCQDRDTHYLCMFPSQKSLEDFCTQSGQCK